MKCGSDQEHMTGNRENSGTQRLRESQDRWQQRFQRILEQALDAEVGVHLAALSPTTQSQ